MINRVTLTGRLTKDAELKYTSSGTAVASFTIAVNRQFTNAQGEREADFINCVMWRKAAENFCNFTHKGSLVGIDGRIQTRNYENDQGNRVFVTEVLAENFSLLEPKSSNQQLSNKQPQQPSNTQPTAKPTEWTTQAKEPKQKTYEEVNGMNKNGTYENESTQQADITDDDLPF